MYVIVCIDMRKMNWHVMTVQVNLKFGSGRARWVRLLRFEMQNSHGDLKKLSDSALVDLIHCATSELHSRLALAKENKKDIERSFSSGSFEQVDQSPVHSQKEDKALKEPWSCGFRCKWCKCACTRREGHTHHSCYEHRHRR